jgi:hypothetical protein
MSNLFPKQVLLPINSITLVWKHILELAKLGLKMLQLVFSHIDHDIWCKGYY